MLKKITVMALVLALMLCAMACSKTPEQPQPTAAPTAEPTAEPTTEPTSEPATEPTTEPAAEPAEPADTVAEHNGISFTLPGYWELTEAEGMSMYTTTNGANVIYQYIPWEDELAGADAETYDDQLTSQMNSAFGTTDATVEVLSWGEYVFNGMAGYRLDYSVKVMGMNIYGVVCMIPEGENHHNITYTWFVDEYAEVMNNSIASITMIEG